MLWYPIQMDYVLKLGLYLFLPNLFDFNPFTKNTLRIKIMRNLECKISYVYCAIEN